MTHYRDLFCFVLKLLTQKGATQLTSSLLASELAATTATLEAFKAPEVVRAETGFLFD